MLIRKGEPARNDRTMTVIISTAGLEAAVFPLEKALAGAVLGMDVNVAFEGAGVRLLQRGYRSRLSGLVGRVFTSKVEQVMKKEIGWPLPQESILMLQDLGAHFYLCGPSMFGYGVHEQDLIIDEYTVGAVITWADLLARSRHPDFLESAIRQALAAGRSRRRDPGLATTRARALRPVEPS